MCFNTEYVEKLTLGGAVPPLSDFEGPEEEGEEIPGEVILSDGKISVNVNRKAVKLTVTNTGDRPIQASDTCSLRPSITPLCYIHSNPFALWSRMQWTCFVPLHIFCITNHRI